MSLWGEESASCFGSLGLAVFATESGRADFNHEACTAIESL